MCSSTPPQSSPHLRTTWGLSTQLTSVTVMEGKCSPCSTLERLNQLSTRESLGTHGNGAGCRFFKRHK